MAQIALDYSAAQINAAVAKINNLVSVIEGSIVQLYDGSTAIYPYTKAEAVFFDNDTSKTLDQQFSQLEQEQIQGGVYDISAHNNDAVFESLSVLLNSSDLNTLIPTLIRHGGMSIRFIQGSVSNSDNKYVQFRCMSDEFTTDENQWQGISDKPEVDSNDLVTSFGISDAINEAFDAIKVECPIHGIILAGQTQITEGNPYRTSDYIPVKQGDVIRFKSKCSTGGYTITGYKGESQSYFENNNSISILGKSADAVNEIIAIVPPKVKYIRITQATEYTHDDYTYIFIGHIKDVVDTLSKKAFGNLIDCTSVYNGIVDPSGQIIDGNYGLSDFIPVEEGREYIVYNGYCGADALYVSAYSDDEQSAFLPNSSINKRGNGGINYIRFIPSSSEKYIRVTYSYTDGDKPIVSETVPKLKSLLSLISDNIENLEHLLGTEATYNIQEYVLIEPNGQATGAPSTRWAATDFIPVTEGDTITFMGGSGSTNCLGISAYSTNSQSSFIQDSSANVQYKTTSVEKIVGIIPAGVNYVRLNLDKQIVGNISYFEVSRNSILTQIEHSLEDCLSRIKTIEDVVGDTRTVSLVENVLINLNGTTTGAPSTRWGATPFIPVSQGDIISFVGGGGDNCLAVSAYSSNTQSSFISGSTVNIPYSIPYSQGGGSVEKITVIIPAGVNYIRICKDRQILAGNSIDVTFNSRFDEQEKRITELESKENAEKEIGLPLFKLSDNYSNTALVTSWQKNTDNYFSNSLTGISNAFKVNKQYALIDAIFMFDFIGAANSKLHFGTANGNTMITDIIVDYSTNKLIVKSQTDIEESAAFNSDHKYRLQVIMNNGALKASVYDLLDYTLVVEITDNSDKSGRMAYNPICYCESGSIYLYDFISDCKHNESGVYRLLITGDSITHGTAAEPLTNGYALLVQNALGIDKVKISAHSGGNIDNVLARIDDELSHLKVKFVMVMIGTNGGNTIDKLNKLLNKIVSYGAVPILNHIPCDWYNEYIGSTEPPLYLARNEMIDQVIAAYPYKVDCCKMDLATSIGHILSGGCNKAIYDDTVHPKTAGHQMMFNQVKIDCPYLFD